MDRLCCPILLLAVLSLLLALPAGAATRVYVSPQGKDTDPGTADKPLQTLAAAQQAVRRVKATAAGPVEVILKAGTYTLSAPLVFTPEDSGTAAAPITWRAADGAKVMVSGGVPITGWQKRPDGLWAAPAPAGRDFRLLRVGDKWATRARHPNFDPRNPRTGGWTFAQYGGQPWEKGSLNNGVQNTHNVNDLLVWRANVPAAGKYRVWLRYGHKMTDYGRPDMSGASAMRAGEGEWQPLQGLLDTGAWNSFKWAHVTDLDLVAGEQTISWTNLKGGGLNLDAFVLTNDEGWDPNAKVGAVQWWGAADIQPVAAGKQFLLVQCEACEKAEGPEIRVPAATPPGQMDGITYAEGAFPHLADAPGAEVHIFIAWGWVNAIVGVDRVDEVRRRIVFDAPGAAQDVRMGNRFFVENVREALDAPGEWFLDKARGEVLYLPDSKDFPRQPVVAPVLDRLVELKGDPDNGRFVEHLRFSGLRFADTDYGLTTEYYHPREATIWMAGARNCEVRDCEFAWLGGYALRLENRSEQCRFVRNRVHDMGQGGVILWGGTKEQAHHCAVLGNTMERLGLIYKHVAGVYVTHGSDNHIAWNRITDVPRYAISCKSQGEDKLSHRNVVEYNEMLRTNLETNDTGAFESLGYEHRDSGNVVRYNLILDSVGLLTTPEGEIKSPYFTWGIYLDDYSSGTTVFGNIVARTVVGGGCIHGGQNNHFENNVFVEGSEHQMRLQPRDDFCKGNTFVNNVIAYSRPEAQVFFCWRDPKGVFAECDRNLYWLTTGDLTKLDGNITPVGPWAKWLEAGHDRNSVVADPLFVNPAKDDYRLKPESPAWKLGFQQIPVEKIGPKGLPAGE